MRSRARNVESGAGRQRQGAGGRREETQSIAARCTNLPRAGPARIRYCPVLRGVRTKRHPPGGGREACRRPEQRARRGGYAEAVGRSRRRKRGAKPPRTKSPRGPHQKRIRAANADSKSRGGEISTASRLEGTRLRRDRLVPRPIIRANRRGPRWRHVEAYCNALQFRTRSGIKFHNERIMAWNDVALVRRQCQQPVEALQHFADMKG